MAKKFWIKAVKTKRHAPAGLFAHGSAKKIAVWAKRGVSQRRAVRSLVFYMNRAGGNLSGERRQVIKRAMELVRGSKARKSGILVRKCKSCHKPIRQKGPGRPRLRHERCQ